MQAGGFEGLRAMTRTGHNSGVIVSAVSQIIFTLTQSQLLSGVRGQSEAQHRHGGNQQARHNQVKKVVQSSSSDLDDKGDVQIWLRTTLINNLISGGWNI